MTIDAPKFVWLAVDSLHLNPNQPRQWFDEEKIAELARSIAEHGLLQPLVVDVAYQIIAGERRYRAAKWLGWLEVPCMIISTGKTQQNLLALIENLQREQMEPLEQALAFARLQQEHAWTHEHIAQTLGKSRSYVSNLLRLLKLSPKLIQALQEQILSYGHARVLVGLTPKEQEDFLVRWQQHPCSVRQLEQQVGLYKQKTKTNRASLPSEAHFLQHLGAQAGTEVTIEMQTAEVGWLKFKFFDQDTLEGLLQNLGLVYD